MSHRKGKTEKKFLKSAFLKIKGSIIAQIDPTVEPGSFQINMSHNHVCYRIRPYSVYGRTKKYGDFFINFFPILLPVLVPIFSSVLTGTNRKIGTNRYCSVLSTEFSG